MNKNEQNLAIVPVEDIKERWGSLMSEQHRDPNITIVDDIDMDGIVKDTESLYPRQIPIGGSDLLINRVEMPRITPTMSNNTDFDGEVINTITLKSRQKTPMDKILKGSEKEDYDKSRYTAKDLSWIEFDKRILDMAKGDKPIMERLKFLAISASNLDEFNMVRYGNLVNKLDKEEMYHLKYGISAKTEEKIISYEIKNMRNAQYSIFEEIKKELFDKHNIEIISKSKSKKTKKSIANIFDDYLYNAITPVVFDESRPFPFIKNKAIYIGVILRDKQTGLKVIGTIQVPDIGFRYFEVKGDKRNYLISVEDVILNNINRLFINKEIVSTCVFRLLRNSDVEVNSIKDNTFLTEEMKNTLKKREQGKPIMLEMTRNKDDESSKELSKVIIKALDLNKKYIYKTKLVDISSIANIKTKHIHLESDEKFNPQVGESFIGESDIYSLLDKQDVVLHHPYESFEHVVQFVEQAASDPDVLTIKQTLYRVSKQSPIMAALIKAAKAGKQVICLLEIKARFNEEENLIWADKLEQAGGHVIYGVENLKTHCKMTMVVRKTKKELKTYCHLSTGNYNEVTGKIYTDISYFTSDNKICSDVSKLFNTLTGFSEPRLKKLISAPHNMRHELMALIDKEIQASKDNKPCGINLKCNSIDDIGIIDKLYEASEAGVKINIVARGICCLRSCQEYSKNITVKSIVGKFLEHSRIYDFKASNKIYIGSADLMERNISRRFELLTPITDKECKIKVREILDTFINDNSAYILEDRKYRKLEGTESSQEIFMNKSKNVNKYKNINKIFIRKRK